MTMGNVVVLSLAILCSKAVIRFSSGGCSGSALSENEDVDVHGDDALVFGSCSVSVLLLEPGLGFVQFVFLMMRGCGTRSSWLFGIHDQRFFLWSVLVVLGVSDARSHSLLTPWRSVERRFGLGVRDGEGKSDE